MVERLPVVFTVWITIEGCILGMLLAVSDGAEEGDSLGLSLGEEEGFELGDSEGCELGCDEGCDEGWTLGDVDGLFVGERVCVFRGSAELS